MGKINYKQLSIIIKKRISFPDFKNWEENKQFKAIVKVSQLNNDQVPQKYNHIIYDSRKLLLNYSKWKLGNQLPADIINAIDDFISYKVTF
jgi:hypothetical protein